ncbi:MAG TPA: hypothetical protein VG982_01785 [Candidatus Paceibacterota bacterium]|nr:hypothetical protein [Candidatus Paceibacterota bacterium]
MKSLTFVKTGKLVLFCFFIGFGCTPGSSPGGGVTPPPTSPQITFTAVPQGPQWYKSDTLIGYNVKNATSLSVNGHTVALQGTISLEDLVRDTTLTFIATGALQRTEEVKVYVRPEQVSAVCQYPGTWALTFDEEYFGGTWHSIVPTCENFVFHVDSTVSILNSRCNNGLSDGYGEWYFASNYRKIMLAQSPDQRLWDVRTVNKDTLKISNIGYPSGDSIVFTYLRH